MPPMYGYYAPQQQDWLALNYARLQDQAAANAQWRIPAMADFLERQRQLAAQTGLGSDRMNAWRQQNALAQQRQYEWDMENARAAREEQSYYNRAQLAHQQELDRMGFASDLDSSKQQWLAQNQAYDKLWEAKQQENRDWRLGAMDVAKQADAEDYQWQRDQFASQQQASRDAAAREQSMAELLARERFQQGRDRFAANTQEDRDYYLAQEQAKRDARLSGYETDRLYETADLQEARDARLNALEMQKLGAGHEYQTARDRQLADMIAQRQYEQQQAEGLRRGTLRYTTDQEQRIQGWEKAIDDIQHDPNWSNDPKRVQAISELQRKIRSVVPRTTRQGRDMTQSEMIARNHLILPTGVELWQQPDGNWIQIKRDDKESKGQIDQKTLEQMAQRRYESDRKERMALARDRAKDEMTMRSKVVTDPLNPNKTQRVFSDEYIQQFLDRHYGPMEQELYNGRQYSRPSGLPEGAVLRPDGTVEVRDPATNTIRIFRRDQ